VRARRCSRRRRTTPRGRRFSDGQVYRVSISTLKANELPRASGIYLGGFAYQRM
jgi:hypothetical protein